MRRTVTVCCLALALALSACGDDPAVDEAADAEPSPEPADPGTSPEGEPSPDAAPSPAAAPEEDAALSVVSTVAPIADVVARVLGERGEVTPLIPSGMDSHTYEPRPGDVVPLTDADAFIGSGLRLNEAAVQLAEANLPDDAPLVLLGEEVLAEGDLSFEHWHDHDDGHDHDGHSHDDGAENDAPDLDDVNPHVWTSVPNVIAYVDRIVEVLSELDPEGSEAYAANAEAYREHLEALDAAIRDAVASLPEERRRLVVHHDAWTYFGAEYGVEVVAAVQPSDFSEPSAADVRAIVDQVREEGVPALFGSEEFPSDVVEVVAEETDATYVGDLADDELPGEPDEPRHSYVGMMAENVALVVDSLGGDAGALEALLDDL